MANPGAARVSGNDLDAPSPCLLNESEAARLLDLRVATLRRWRWSGKGPRFVKLGSAVRYDRADLDAFIDAGRKRSTSDLGPQEVPAV